MPNKLEMAQRFETNAHDVEMTKVMISGLLTLFKELNQPVTHNHYHHTEPIKTPPRNPYRDIHTVGELEDYLLSQPKSIEFQSCLKSLARYKRDRLISNIEKKDSFLLSLPLPR